MKKLLIAITCLSLLLWGCNDSKEKELEESSEVTNPIEEGDYSALLPFEASSSRIKHAQTSTDLSESFTIGVGLMEYSKQYFASNSYSYKEGSFLSYGVLDAFDDQMGLLGRTSENNPNGMNPEIGASFDTNKGSVKIGASDVLLIDIQEIDWYQDKTLKGLSLAIILNDEIGDKNDYSIINDSMLKAYGEEVGRKVVSYLRKTYPEIGTNTPIYVALFKESSYNSSLPGVFIEEAYFSNRTVGEYSKLSESYALFPSSNASLLDSTNATYFDRFVKENKNFFPEDTSIIGMGYFKNDTLDTLTIDVSMHAKTWSEANALIQNINKTLSIFSQNNFKINVRIYSDNVLCASMQRAKGSSKVEAMILVK